MRPRPKAIYVRKDEKSEELTGNQAIPQEKDYRGKMTDILQLVMDGMGCDKETAQQWFNTPNRMINGETPNGYELSHSREALENFIRFLCEIRPLTNDLAMPFKVNNKLK